jgi:hypothetical protein
MKCGVRANYSPQFESGLCGLRPIAQSSRKHARMRRDPQTVTCHTSAFSAAPSATQHKLEGLEGGVVLRLPSRAVGLGATREKDSVGASAVHHVADTYRRTKGSVASLSLPLTAFRQPSLQPAARAGRNQGTAFMTAGCLGYMTLGRECRPPRMSGEDVRTRR